MFLAGQLAHTDGVYSDFFFSTKQLGVFQLLLDGMLVHCMLAPQH